MPFCKSCGDLLDLSRPRCTSCSLTIPQAVRDAVHAATPGRDTWTRKYCTPPPSTSPRTRTTSSTTPTQQSARTTPSRARTQSQLAQPHAVHPRPSATAGFSAYDAATPLVPSHTGSSDRSNASLTMVCGSVLSKRTPESARCAECRTFFGRGEGEDRTIYPIPGSDPLSTDAFLCHGCYARSFKRDDCPACARPVLGIKGDPYISANGRDYHERCFRCIRCLKAAQLINIARQPSCNACFDVSPACTAQEVPAVAVRPSDALGGRQKPNATERLVLQFQQAGPSASGRAAAAGSSSGVGPSVSELRERFAFVNRDVAGKTALAGSIAAPAARPTTNDSFKLPQPLTRTERSSNVDGSTRPLTAGRSTQSTSAVPPQAPRLPLTTKVRDESRPQAASGREPTTSPFARRTVLASRNETMRLSAATAAPRSDPTPTPASSPAMAVGRGERRPVLGWRTHLLEHDGGSDEGTKPTSADRASASRPGGENVRLSSTAVDRPPAGRPSRLPKPAWDETPASAAPPTEKVGKTPAPWTVGRPSVDHGAEGGTPKKRSVLERAGVRHLGR